MPFKSKAQQRFMFATQPRKAKEWAAETKDMKGLPEKIHPQKSIPKSEYKEGRNMTKKADGMFFQKTATSKSGHFFRDLPGRDKANFHQKTAQMGGQMIPRGGGMNVSPAGSQMFGTGKPTEQKTESIAVAGRGEPSSGEGGTPQGPSMYGSGEGAKKQSDEERLKALLAKASKGEERKAEGGKEEDEKTAALDPSDWSASSGLPTGFHRPAGEQPEALEAGGERFHSPDAEGPEFGSGVGITHGLVEGGSMNLKKGSNHNLGKHASAGPPRFLGTSYGLEKQAKMKYDQDYAKDTGEKFKRSLTQLGESGVRAADKAVQGIAGSPVAAGLATLLAARMGLRGAKGLGRGALSLAGVKRRPPKSLVGQAVGSIKKLVG